MFGGGKILQEYFDLKPTIYQNITNNYTLYVPRNDIVPRKSGGVLNSLQIDIPIYEHAEAIIAEVFLLVFCLPL